MYIKGRTNTFVEYYIALKGLVQERLKQMSLRKLIIPFENGIFFVSKLNPGYLLTHIISLLSLPLSDVCSIKGVCVGVDQ